MSESEPAAATSGPLAPDAVMDDTVAIDSEDPLAAPDDSITRDSDVWYEDGNIVVIAQTTAFRFHKSVVSHHSSVFRDLFSVPTQPSSESTGEAGASTETFDGCAAVRVSDTSYDFRELLRAIYGGVSYLRLDQIVTFPVLAALARLSHKYQLAALLSAVLPRLQGTFTTSLVVWDAAGALLAGSAFEFDQAIEALNLFRLLADVQPAAEMVPVALYGCCQLPPADLLCGIARADGVTRETLGPEDLVLCLEAKGRLLRATVNLVVRLSEAYEARIALVAGGQAECSPSQAAAAAAAGESQSQPQSQSRCLGALGALVADCRRYLHESIDEDPLDTFYASGLHYSVSTQVLCGACGDALGAEYARLRREVWRGLPGFMGMEVAGWDSDSGDRRPEGDLGQE